MPSTACSVADMAEIIKTAALAVSVCVLCAVIKQYRPEYAPIVQIAAVAV